MIGILLSGNLFQMYFFWELVGFSSYLLIGFWYTKKEAIEASKKAFIMNRFGDICLLIGIFMVLEQQGNVDILTLAKFSETQKSTLLGLLLFGGCIAKSAQFPLHTWLPDAMEGPTPVSALIHAATMVAAGIYLIIRVSPVFNPEALQIITIIGCISMLMAGSKAILQSDIKKVLAYSTISQLGLMVVAVGGGAPNLAFNHLITHAFFKAGLFLCAGTVIYSIHHTKPKIDAQNMYLMGGLRKEMPITFICFVLCTCSMIGLPFFSGFVTKDSIIELWHEKEAFGAKIVFISLLISSVLSAFYMGRQLFLVFINEKQEDDKVRITEKHNSIFIKLPIIILAVLSTFLILLILKLEVFHFNLIALINTILVLSGLYLVYFFRKKISNPVKYHSIIDQFYDTVIAKNTIKISTNISNFDTNIFDGATKLATNCSLIVANIIDWFDVNLIDGLVNFTAKLSNKIGSSFTKIQSGQFQWYISAIIVLLLIVFLASVG
jgi:NADH-quinone oxidoreductase subunit L